MLGVTLNSKPADERRLASNSVSGGPGSRPVGLDGSVTYTQQQLLELRRVSTAVPSDDVVALLRHLGLRRRRRGVRAGRKSRRPIPTRVSVRAMVGFADRGRGATNLVRSPIRSGGRGQHLILPPRLTIRQTRQAETQAAVAKRSALNVGHLNVRSLMAHIDEVNHLLLSERLDVLCISETWLTDAVESRMLQFPGYVISRCDRLGGKSGGGVAIIYRNTMTAEPLRIPAATSALETLWLRLTLASPIIVGVVYRPPSSPTTPALDDLYSQLTDVLGRNLPVYLLGDTNFDASRPAKQGVTSYLQQLSDLSLTQLITAPTHPGPNPSLIDHFITSKPDLTTNVRVVPCNFSDHDLIAATVSVVKTRHVASTISVRSTRRVNTDALCLDLLQADWSLLYAADSTTNKWSSFLRTWSPIIDAHMPVRTVKLKHRPFPWLQDDEVREAMAARDQARRDRQLTPCDATEAEFRLRRNAVKTAINRACESYFQTSYRNSRSKTWRDIRQFLVSSGKASQPGSTSHHDPDWADRLNSFFASVGGDVARSLAATDGGDLLPPRPPRVCSGAFSPRPATLPELSTALRRMSSSRACGPDGITVEMLRMTFAVVGPHLLHIVNSCITKCDMPALWKSADVIPLYKKGDRYDPSNYRPISIIPVVAKLCERVVCSQLMSYLDCHSLICPQQYGFRPGMSTGAAMLDVISYATENIDRGLVTPLVTADTSKAFDSVEHVRLLDKLGWYGIRRDWFADWLQGRSQSIGSSRPVEVTHGVIQGSILGPILFLLFTNDLVQHLPQGKVVMYADDVQFLDADAPSNMLALKKRVENNLSVALKWFAQNRLKINPAKTEMIILKSRRQNSNTSFSVLFGRDTVSPSLSVKVLGVTVDTYLAWDAHVTSIVQRCNMILVGLARMRSRVPRETKRLLVEALVFPHIRYCISVWGSCTTTQKKRVQKVINFGARIVTGLGRREHVTPVLSELGWECVDDMVRSSDLAVMSHLLTSDTAPELLRNKLVLRSDRSARVTRATERGQMQLPRVKTEFARRSFIFRATKHWNDIS